jgi:hypothetical protein
LGNADRSREVSRWKTMGREIGSGNKGIGSACTLQEATGSSGPFTAHGKHRGAERYWTRVVRNIVFGELRLTLV